MMKESSSRKVALQYEVLPDGSRRYNHDRSVIAFCRARGSGGSFSNCMRMSPKLSLFWEEMPAPFKTPFSENLFHALKFPCDINLQQDIFFCSSWSDGKLLAREAAKSGYVRKDWVDGNVSFAAMRYVVRLKILQSALCRKELHDFKDRLIVELSLRDRFWGAKPIGNKLIGHNYLGRLWMEARESFFKGLEKSEYPCLDFPGMEKLVLFGRSLPSLKVDPQQEMAQKSEQGSLFPEGKQSSFEEEMRW